LNVVLTEHVAFLDEAPYGLAVQDQMPATFSLAS
jgi:hypothetical protein